MNINISSNSSLIYTVPNAHFICYKCSSDVLLYNILVTKGKTWSAVDGERSDISLLLRINNCMLLSIQLFIVGNMA